MRPKPLIARLDYALFSVLLTLSMLFPGLLSEAKVVLLCAYVAVRLIHLDYAGRPISVLYGLLIPVAFSAVGAAYCFYGLLLDAPGALRVLKVHVAYPLVLGFLASTASVPEAEQMFDCLKTVCVMTVFVLLGGIILLLAGYDVTQYFDNSAASIGVVPGISKLSFKIVDSLNFIIPFVFAYTVITGTRRALFLYSTVVPAIVVESIISGRRTFWLLLCFSTFVPLLAGRRKVLRFSLLGLLLAFGMMAAFRYAGLEVSVLGDYFRNGFDFTSSSADAGGLERGEQLRALVAGFADRPLFGHGLGATAVPYGSLRSIETPEAYELSYVYYLFATGIVGFMIYSIGLAFLLRGLWRTSRIKGQRARALSLLVGLIGFMISNAIDPWLSKFDFMYVIFIPYAYVAAFRTRLHRGEVSPALRLAAPTTERATA